MSRARLGILFLATIGGLLAAAVPVEAKPSGTAGSSCTPKRTCATTSTSSTTTTSAPSTTTSSTTTTSAPSTTTSAPSTTTSSTTTTSSSTTTSSTTTTSAPSTTTSSTTTTSAPSTSSTAAAAAATAWVSPEGITISVAPDVSGWTPQAVYQLLQASAVDLALVGPTLTVEVQTTSPSSTSAGAAASGGVYRSYRAVIYLQATASSTFTAFPDAVLAHEYGHAWSLYWYYLAHQADWTSYLQARGLLGDPRLDTTYAWGIREILADDYRLLFGSPAAVGERPTHLNPDIADPRAVPGLRDVLATAWSAG